MIVLNLVFLSLPANDQLVFTWTQEKIFRRELGIAERTTTPP